MVFYHVPPHRLRDTWPDIRAAVEQVIAKTGERWLPEDVYCAIQDGKAVLYVGYEADEPRFVFVNSPEDEWGRKVLRIWLAASLGGDLQAAIDWVRGHARAYGFDQVTFASPRKGWAKYFKPIQTIYEV